MRVRNQLLIGLAALLGQGLALADSIWIHPASYRPCIGKPLQVHLHTQPGGSGIDVTTAAFFVMDGRGVSPLSDAGGGDASGVVEVVEPGFLVLGYRGRSPPATPGISVFAKALLVAGVDVPQHGHNRRVGFPLELVVLDNPYRYGGGTALGVALFQHGLPLAGVRVSASTPRSARALVATTLGDGVARFTFPHGGEWTLSAEVDTPPGAGHRTSLSFELPQRDDLTPSLTAGAHCIDSLPQG